MILDVKTTKNNYFERTDLLNTYYDSARKFDTLTEDEERVLLNEYAELKAKLSTEKGKTNNVATIERVEKELLKVRDKLINANLKFVISIARIYAKNYDILDLIEEGNTGLIKAIDKFDVNSGNRFTTYAVQWIRETINLYRQRYGSMVRKSNVSKVFHIIPKVTNEFIQTNHREPTAKELKDFINEKYPKLDLKDCMDLINIRMTSIDEPVDDEDEANVSNMTLYNEYSSSDNEYESTTDSDYNKVLVGSLLKSLDERAQKIVKMYFGIGEKYGQQKCANEIAESVGLTVERTRQIISEAKKILKDKYAEMITNAVLL